MDTTTLLVIVILVVLLGGGGFFYRRRSWVEVALRPPGSFALAGDFL